jgi:hypothetical protein
MNFTFFVDRQYLFGRMAHVAAGDFINEII